MPSKDLVPARQPPLQALALGPLAAAAGQATEQEARHLRILPWLVAVGFFMQTLDGTILNTALPAMARELHESPLRMQSVVLAYMVTVALLIPASGWLADRFGTRRVFVGAMALFTFGSMLCALSPTLPLLVVVQLSMSLGVAAGSGLLLAFSGAAPGGAVPPSAAVLRHAFHVTFLVVGGLTLLAALIFAQLRDSEAQGEE